MILIFSAMKLEIAGLLKKLKLKKILNKNSPEIFEGYFNNKKIIIVISGIGKERAIFASKFVISRFLKMDGCINKEVYSIDKIIVVGTSGALTSNLNIGDLIICSKIINMEQILQEYPSWLKFDVSEDYYHLKDYLLKENINDRNKIIIGNLVTVTKVFTETAEKKNLGLNFNAQIIDMESYWILNLLSRFKIKLLCIRSISDDLKHSLPGFFNDLSKMEKNRNFLYFLTFLLKSPYVIIKLFQAGKNFKFACKKLQIAIENVL